MELKPITTKFNPGEEVTYHKHRGRIVAIHASSVVGRIGQKDDVSYDIDTGEGIDSIIEGVDEAMVERAE